MRRRAGLTSVVLASALLLAGCGQKKEEKIQLGYNQQPATTSTQAVQIAREQVPVVPVEVVEENNSVRLTGSLMADEKSDVASRASGIVQEVLVDRGSVVRQGTVVVRIDPTNAQNALAEGMAAVQELTVRLGIKDPNEKFNPAQQPEVASAKASLDLAEVSFKRTSNLFSQKVVSAAEFDRARSDYEGSRQRYQQAWHQAAQLYQSYQTALVRLRTLRQAVEDTMVKAPFDGLVAEKHVSPGETLGAGAGAGGGSRVLTLLRIDPLRLLVTVPARNISQVQAGQKVQFQVDAFPDRTFTGAVTRVSPALEAQTRSLIVEARVDNSNYELRPGMFATAQLVLPEQKKTVYVPTAAITRQGDVAKVFVVQEGVARETVITLGEASENRVQVTTGLEAGDRIVADASRAADGMRVQ